MDLALTDNININLNFNSTTYEVKKVIVNKGGTSYVAYEKIDYSQEYFTIESLEDSNSVKLTKQTSAPSITFYSSFDNGSTWTSFSSTKTWTLNKGDKVKIKATTNQLGNSDLKHWTFSSSKEYKVYGNIMSLLYGDNFATQKSLPNYTYTFYALFTNSSYLIDASKLILQATTIRNRCYCLMFSGCTSLVSAPSLPASTMKQYCYTDMFSGCTSLVNAPVLKSKSLVLSCYRHMFQNCTSLTTAPVLPATTLANYCYSEMFSGCSSLNYIKCLATDISATNCLANWVSGVAESGTFVKSSSTTFNTGVNGIPSGWTVQNA